jgi:hypothetical protein
MSFGEKGVRRARNRKNVKRRQRNDKGKIKGERGKWAKEGKS